MAAKEAQEADTKSASGLLIVEGGFEDQVNLSSRSLVRLMMLTFSRFSGWRISVIPRTGPKDKIRSS